MPTEPLVIGPFRVFLGNDRTVETVVEVADKETVSLPGANFLGAWTDSALAIKWTGAVNDYLRKFYTGMEESNHG